MREKLRRALKNIRFQPNELAYLALTSKPEHHVRDRLAWELHNLGVVPIREWQRADLAMFRQGEDKPVALLEAKALYTFEVDPTGPYHRFHWHKYKDAIRNDLAKARKLAQKVEVPGAEIFALVVVTHVLDPVGPDLRGFIKYGKYLRCPANSEAAERRIHAFLQKLGRVDKTRFEGTGEAFSLHAAVDAWLCGPCT